MKKTASYFWLGFCVLLLFIAVGPWSWPGKKQAEWRVNAFIKAVNANRPGDVYLFLTPELKAMLSREEFRHNFAKERSYPYLTPLYLYLDEVKLSSDRRSGEALLTVAARLPGEKMRVKLIYTKGQYYIEAFRDIADGSYLHKFEALK